jgi:hypothetical protein
MDVNEYEEFRKDLRNDRDFDIDYSEFNIDEFIKRDKGKLMLSLIEPEFIQGTAMVLTLGAEKYEIDNWKKCDDTKRYKDALLRHVYDYLNGDKFDDETGVSHLYHACCNLMFLDYFDRKGK